MKRFFCALLAISVALSFCSCGKKDKQESPEQQLPSDDVSLTLEQEPTEEASSKIVGDRITVVNEDEYAYTGWELGEVDVAEIINIKRFPVENKNACIDICGRSDTGAIIDVSVSKTADNKSVLEIMTVYKDTHMMSRMFEIDGQPYAYTYALKDGKLEEHLYKLPSKMDENSSYGDLAESTDVADALNMDNPRDHYKRCEYLGLKNNYDVFKLVNMEDEEFILKIDHKTGWITSVGLPDDTLGGNFPMTVEATIAYDTDGIPYTNIDGRIETNVENFAYFMIAQFLIFSDIDDLSIDGTTVDNPVEATEGTESTSSGA